MFGSLWDKIDQICSGYSDLQWWTSSRRLTIDVIPPLAPDFYQIAGRLMCEMRAKIPAGSRLSMAQYLEITDRLEQFSLLACLPKQSRVNLALCGSALQRESYSILMNGQQATVVFTDPLYNVPIAGHASGNGEVRHSDFQMASGEMNEFEFVSFLIKSLGLMARHSRNGSVHFVCMDWPHMGELHEAGNQVHDALLNICVWVKNVGGMGSFYRSQHEMIFVFRHGKAPHPNNVQLGRFGRNRTNVWEYLAINTLSKHGEEGNLLALHPTVKPVALIADALLDCSARGDAVLDGFLGSGSTLIAAERTGRCCYGIELDPMFIDTAIKRWQRHTGDYAIHVTTEKGFDETADERSEATYV